LTRKVFGKAEVNHFDAVGVIFARQHEVFRLDIAVADPLAVQVHQSRQELSHDQGRLSLAQMLPLDDEVEKLASLAVPTGDSRIVSKLLRRTR